MINDHSSPSYKFIKEQKRSFSSLPILKSIIVLLFELCILVSCVASPTIRPPITGISFYDNWEHGITAPGGWKDQQIVADDRFQRVASTSEDGPYAARIEVRPGDINSSGERAEVVHMSDASGNPIDENESSGTQYYAFSIQLPTNWVPPADDVNGRHWGICLQLHGPNKLGTSPSFAVEATDTFHIDVNGGNLDSPSESLMYQSYPFSDGSLNLGHWVDFVIKIKFAKDFTGSIDVWRANEDQTQFTQVLSVNKIPTLQYKSSLGGVEDHYWKYGYYRANQTSVISILYLGPIARGTTFSGVVMTAFPKRQNLPPN
jgi:hypothetical protein